MTTIQNSEDAVGIRSLDGLQRIYGACGTAPASAVPVERAGGTA